MKDLLKTIISEIKSISVNLRLFSFWEAICMPVYVSYNTKIGELHRGGVIIEKKKRRVLTIGEWDGSFNRGSNAKNYFSIKETGKLIIKETASFSNGCSINIENGGTVILGEKFSTNYGFLLCCDKEISIGNNCLIGWNVTIMDGDGHNIEKDGKKINMPQMITIGNHVWLCAETTVMKGAYIPDNTVVAYRSLVSKRLNKGNVIYAGSPVNMVNQEIEWNK